jgi:hypothetical protein
MYDRVGAARAARRQADTPAGPTPEAAVRQALLRVRKILENYLPGMSCDVPRLESALAAGVPQPAEEAERLFALGWLRWLAGDFTAAGPLLAQAVADASACGAGTVPAEPDNLLARALYWRSRVGIVAGRGEALGEFEAALRGLGGSPRATARFVDLLWRAGRTDRAEKVWKSVRGNHRVLACDEGPLLEARALLHLGECAPAERLLREYVPAGGVCWVERRLLLAWALTTLRHHDRAAATLAEAGQGPYPAAALAAWRQAVGSRAQPEATEVAGPVPVWLRNYLRGQQARLEGQADVAIGAFRAVVEPAATPFARYALACLGQDDPAAVLASQPGLFLAVRCRARLAVERFRRREFGPAELLDALQQAAGAGFQDAGALHFRGLAEALQKKQPDLVSLRRLAEIGSPDPAARRNFLRIALEQAAGLVGRSGGRGEALSLLLDWSQDPQLADDGLRVALGRQLLRLALSEGSAPALNTAEAFLPGEPLLRLARPALDTNAPGADVGDLPHLRLLQAARLLAVSAVGTAENWRQEVRQLREETRLRPLAQALLLQEAAARGDVSAVAALLDETDAWRGFRPAPPGFVVGAAAAVVARQPEHPAWRRSLPRWLQLWEPDALGPAGATLAAQAGLAVDAGAVGPPPGTSAVPWLLHNAARALGREDTPAALAFVRRALALDPGLAGVADAEVVRAALSELEHHARAQALAGCLYGGWAAPGLLVDFSDLLNESDEGRAVLQAAGRRDVEAVRAGLARLAERPDLPARLAHHLAVAEWRAAPAAEESQPAPEARARYHRAWGCWLRLLATPDVDAPPSEARGVLLDWLLGEHRRRVHAFLAQNAIDAARQHWALVQELPARAGELDPLLRADLETRVASWRDDLATDYLLSTREAMRFGAIPEGWRGDYERGLTHLRRLLSLDRDNVRLLTAMVEICGEWFDDLYNAGDRSGLAEQADRYTPFAVQLARLASGREGELAARAAVSSFYLFRGLLAGDHGRKAALYREAVRFNPANANARDLLAGLGEPPDEGSDPPSTE